MNLKSAINEFELRCNEASSQEAEPIPECIQVVLAAARAFACERCGGTSIAMRKDKPWQIEHLDCPDCQTDREKASGE